MPVILKRFALVPALGLVAGALVLIGTALAGSATLPEQARSLTNPPAEADSVAPAPEGLSSASTARDWQEVGTSPAKPKPPKDPPKPPPGPPGNKPPKDPKEPKPAK